MRRRELCRRRMSAAYSSSTSRPAAAMPATSGPAARPAITATGRGDGRFQLLAFLQPRRQVPQQTASDAPSPRFFGDACSPPSSGMPDLASTASRADSSADSAAVMLAALWNVQTKHHGSRANDQQEVVIGFQQDEP